MSDMMTFPATVEEFMEQYKMTDTEHVYSNGTEYIPIYRMKQWFEHCRNHQLLTIDAVPVVRCEKCVLHGNCCFCHQMTFAAAEKRRENHNITQYKDKTKILRAVLKRKELENDG